MHDLPGDSSTIGKRLLLIEDHAIVRESLVGLIHGSTEYRVVGATGNGREAVGYAATLQPAVILVDFHLEGGFDGLELIKALRAACPAARMVVLTAFSHGQRHEEVLRCGADGLIGKSDPPELLFAALAGGEVRRAAPKECRPVAFGGVSTFGGLSDRERAVLRLFAEGYPVREVAARLGVSRKTIEAHRCNIREKLGVPTSDELRALARRYFGRSAE